MEIGYILTDEAPKPIGPYSQATILKLSDDEGLIFTSGQVAIDAKLNKFLDGDITAQTRLVCENLKAVLKASKSAFEKVLKATVFLTDITEFKAMNEVYEEYFGKPARSAIGVNKLPLGAKVEIEVIAYYVHLKSLDEVTAEKIYYNIIEGF